MSSPTTTPRTAGPTTDGGPGAGRTARGGTRTTAAWRRIRLLTGAYLALCLLTLVAAGLLGDRGDVDDAVWTRGIIVAVVALITRLLVSRAARGSGRALLRLRLMTALQVVAIAAILAVPGPFPLWMKVEQGLCGVLLLAVVVVVNGRAVRASSLHVSGQGRPCR